MTQPTLTDSGQRLYNAIAPLMNSDQPGMSDSENGYAGAILCGALATMGLDDAAYVARDGLNIDENGNLLPPFAVLFDVDNVQSKWLVWLSQFVGDSQAVQNATLPIITNLVPNPSFEHDTIGQAPAACSELSATANYSAFDVQVGGAASGSNSLRLTWTNPDGATYYPGLDIGASPNGLPVLGGQTYYFHISTDYVSTPPGQISLAVNWYTSGGTLISHASAVGGTWPSGSYSAFATAPSNAATAELQAFWTSAAIGDKIDVYLDEVMFIASTTSVPYFDGDTLNYKWTGTPGDSSSVTVPGTTDVAAQRALIKNPVQFTRGRPATIVQKAQTTLTGSQTVLIDQRTGDDAWTLTVATFTSQTPDPVATKTAILSVMPAWLVPTIDVVTGGDYETLSASHSTYSEMEAAHTHYSDIPTNPAA